MKKRTVAFLLVLIMALAVPAYGVQPRILQIYPTLTFSGETATYGVSVMGNNSTDKISATVEFWSGNRRLENWSAEGNGYVIALNSTNATPGKAYTVKVFVTINDESQPMVSTRGVCPEE